jgi:pyrroloquinoline quinone (PQQ) biosynthesis protein C
MADKVLSPQGQQCLQALMREWFEFERGMNRVPIIKRLLNGTLTNEDYQLLLLNLRQQVVEGARWITRCASSFDRTFADVRSEIIGHAQDEHRDYQILEWDYVAAGGTLADIQNGRRNPGSEALHGFLMHRASQPNPVDMIGAMWIIEGIGQKMASEWSMRLETLLPAGKNCLQFMAYHGKNDAGHMDKLYRLLDRVCQSDAAVQDIMRTARVTARLYCLQLEEIDYAC